MAGKKTFKDRWSAFRSRFSKKGKVKKDLEKVEKLTEEQQHREDLKKRLFSLSAPKKKKKRVHLGLERLLEKAGIELSAAAFRKRVFLSAVILSLSFSLAMIIYGGVSGADWFDVMVFMLAFWTVGFLGVVILAAIVGAGILDIRITNRRKQVEEVLPDYLQLTAANISAGMTVDRALWYAVRPRFGVLAKEIEDVAKEVISGAELDDALRRFSERYDSPVLQRSIALLLEGIAAGGKIADLLNKIATDIQEQRILRKEMSANVTTYVIFISFAAIIAAPILFGLATELLIVIKTIAGNLGENASSGSLSVSPDVILLSDFRAFSFVTLIGTALMSSFIVGVIRTGEAFEGLRFLPWFISVSLFLYTVAAWMFHSMFSGLI